MDEQPTTIRQLTAPTMHLTRTDTKGPDGQYEWRDDMTKASYFLVYPGRYWHLTGFEREAREAREARRIHTMITVLAFLFSFTVGFVVAELIGTALG